MILSMIDPVNATNTVAQLTAEQISGMMQDRVLGLFISLGLGAVGTVFGKATRNELKKVVGYILAILGAIGTIGFTLSLISLAGQMT